MTEKEINKLILKLLKLNYPIVKTQLNFKNDYECIVAVSLSAQTTDNQVNKVTPELFRLYSNVYKLAAADPEEVEPLINRCGLYKNKSRNLVKMARIIVKNFDGKIPSDLIDLMSLPGVGRKTANVVRSTIFNQPAIAVDTHVFRVSKRLGMAKGDNVNKVENELMKVIPQKDWSATHHRLIYHGRNICLSRKPRCEDCFFNKLCPENN